MKNSLKNTLIENINNLKLEVPNKLKTYLDELIVLLNKDDLKSTDIIEIQEKIEEICLMNIDSFTRNELYNLISILEDLN